MANTQYSPDVSFWIKEQLRRFSEFSGLNSQIDRYIFSWPVSSMRDALDVSMYCLSPFSVTRYHSILRAVLKIDILLNSNLTMSSLDTIELAESLIMSNSIRGNVQFALSSGTTNWQQLSWETRSKMSCVLGQFGHWIVVHDSMGDDVEQEQFICCLRRLGQPPFPKSRGRVWWWLVKDAATRMRLCSRARNFLGKTKCAAIFILKCTLKHIQFVHSH